MKPGSFPMLRRSSADIRTFPEKMETMDYDMPYQEYVLLGKRKDTGEIQQTCVFRLSKTGIDGGLGRMSFKELKKIFSELHLYRLKQHFEFIKLSEKELQKIIKIDKIFND